MDDDELLITPEYSSATAVPEEPEGQDTAQDHACNIALMVAQNALQHSSIPEPVQAAR